MEGEGVKREKFNLIHTKTQQPLQSSLKKHICMTAKIFLQEKKNNEQIERKITSLRILFISPPSSKTDSELFATCVPD